ncbi:PBECR3 domain-containing polyvalent protein [Streptococcus troglodytae]|uniref:PBECR3 domain-containing polyvalent protein n=1 Tax=Streptococcus troglodytae TaxID=1111760 RepID=UPI00210F33AD|nr:hypothetical protein [Streptococcus troglodytae]
MDSILVHPNYVGINPREKNISMEYVSIFDENLLLGIKLDRKNYYFYLATMHEISNLKLG